MKNRNNSLIKFIDSVILTALCILIIGLPFSNSIIEVSAITAISLWALKKIFIFRQIKVESSPINKPISVYFLFVMLSIFNSNYLVISIQGFGYKAMEHFLLFVVIIDTIKSIRDLKIILSSMLISCAIMALDGFWQYFTHYDFLRHYPIWSSLNRITASFKYPNGFGGWLITVIPVCLALAIFNLKEIYYKALGVILSVMLIICLVLNFTKGAWIAILPALLYLAWKKGDIAKKVLLSALLILLFGIVGLIVFGKAELISSYAARGWSSIHRVDLIKMCFRMFLDKPITGHGINTFMSIYESYQQQSTFSGVSYAHNCYLQIMVETGVLGIISFLWLIVSFFASSFRSINVKSEGMVRTLQIGLTAGLLAYLAHSLFEANLYSLPLAVLFYYFLGLTMACQNISGSK